MPEIARLPQMCMCGINKRFAYLSAKRETDRQILKILYEDHIESCPICRIAWQAEIEWAKGQTHEQSK